MQPGIPSRHLTGYLIYASEVRKRVVNENPHQSFGYISQLIGIDWKALPNVIRNRYNEKALNYNSRVRGEMQRGTENPNEEKPNSRKAKSNPKLTKQKFVDMFYERIKQSYNTRASDLDDPLSQSSQQSPNIKNSNLNNETTYKITNTALNRADAQMESHSPIIFREPIIEDSTRQKPPLHLVPTQPIAGPSAAQSETNCTIKRTLTGFSIFADQMRKQLIDKNLNRSPGYISRLIGDDWKALPDNVKNNYGERALRHNMKLREKTTNRPLKGHITGYIIYASKVRTKVAGEYPNQSSRYINRIIGDKWKALSDDVRAEYHEKAKYHEARTEALATVPVATSIPKLTRRKLAYKAKERMNQIHLSMKSIIDTTIIDQPRQSHQQSPDVKTSDSVHDESSFLTYRQQPLCWL